jgi:hypothetical protein
MANCGVPFTVAWTTSASVTVLAVDPDPVSGYLAPDLDLRYAQPPLVGHRFFRPAGSSMTIVPDWIMRRRPGSIEAVGGIRVVYSVRGSVFSLTDTSAREWLCWSTPSFSCTEQLPSSFPAT